jgi:hypothetical protein
VALCARCRRGCDERASMVVSSRWHLDEVDASARTARGRCDGFGTPATLGNDLQTA